MVKVFRNITTENKIMELLSHRKKLPLKGYSVTKLTCCPRKTYCEFLGIPQVPPVGRELVFTRGRAHHEILEVFRPNEVVVSKDGIPGHIDMIGNRITEIFTTNISSKKVKTEEDVPKVFVMKTKQLEAYLHMVGEVEGDLLVFFLFGDYTRLRVLPNGKTRYTGVVPELMDWTMVFDDNELYRNWQELLAKKELINECLLYNVPKAVFSFIPKLQGMWVKWRNGGLSETELYDLIATRQVIIAQLKLPDWTGEEFECKQCSYAYICPEYNEEVARL